MRPTWRRVLVPPFARSGRFHVCDAPPMKRDGSPSPRVCWMSGRVGRSVRPGRRRSSLVSGADAPVNPAIVFACQYARLVWLLLHDSKNVEEQKDALRAAMAVIGQGMVTIARRGSRVFANGKSLPDTLAAGPELGAQMIAHGVMVIEMAPTSPPADLLGTARILSTPGARGDKGKRAKELIEALKAPSVRFAFEDASLGPRLDPKLAEPTPLPGRMMAATPAMGVGVATPHKGMALVENREMWQQFRAVQVPLEDSEELFAQLDTTEQPNEQG